MHVCVCVAATFIERIIANAFTVMLILLLLGRISISQFCKKFAENVELVASLCMHACIS